jgi:hypothetical protein
LIVISLAPVRLEQVSPAITIARSTGRSVTANDLLKLLVSQFVGSAQFTLDVDSAHLTNSIVSLRAKLSCWL